jgi:hypothetical protein
MTIDLSPEFGALHKAFNKFKYGTNHKETYLPDLSGQK